MAPTLQNPLGGPWYVILYSTTVLINPSCTWDKPTSGTDVSFVNCITRSRLLRCWSKRVYLSDMVAVDTAQMIEVLTQLLRSG